MYGLGALVLILLIVLLTQPSGRRRSILGSMAPIMAFLMVLLVLGGVAAAVMAWLHPEYLVSLAYGLGAIAIIVLLLLLQSGRRINIPNPVKAEV